MTKKILRLIPDSWARHIPMLRIHLPDLVELAEPPKKEPEEERPQDVVDEDT